MHPQFKNRIEAGQALAGALEKYKGKPNTVILALPRGGVPVAHEVAKNLNLPMDVWIVRKLGIPGHEELAMGAIALGGVCYINHHLVQKLHLPESAIERVIEQEMRELERRNKLYRDGKETPDIENKTVIIIDDGLATGATMRAAALSLREAKARNIIMAAPVGAASTCQMLENDLGEVTCPYRMEPFYGVGQWYRDFSQTSDQEVQKLLQLSTEKA